MEDENELQALVAAEDKGAGPAAGIGAALLLTPAAGVGSDAGGKRKGGRPFRAIARLKVRVCGGVYIRRASMEHG